MCDGWRFCVRWLVGFAPCSAAPLSTGTYQRGAAAGMRGQRAPLACPAVRALCRLAQLCKLGGTVPASRHSRHQESGSMREGCNRACHHWPGTHTLRWGHWLHAVRHARGCCACSCMLQAPGGVIARMTGLRDWLTCAMSVRPAGAGRPPTGGEDAYARAAESGSLLGRFRSRKACAWPRCRMCRQYLVLDSS